MEDAGLNYLWMREIVRTCLTAVTVLGLTVTVLADNIPVAGNSWIINPVPGNNDSITHNGIVKWENPDSIIRTYFKKTGQVHLAVRAKSDQGESKVRFSFGSVSKEIVIGNSEFENVPLGDFKTDSPGYCFLEMQGIENQKGSFAQISDIIVEGGTEEKIYCVKDEFYWGRRGPSVHLQLLPPEGAGDVLYFYSEITVPKGNDVPGSYFMANGFSVGYFGIQANSPTERKVLFSVWSPYKTDNPKDIPDDMKIVLLKKGADVHAGEFGNEGSGGQSYWKFFWKTGVTYKFLLKGEPSGNDSTDFTAWFFVPESGKWELIASFKRPKTNTYLKHPHSFLENFRPDTGYLTRMAYYSNQWIFTTDKKWLEIKDFNLTADATAGKKARLDYEGGVFGKQFFLKNCGFFDADVKVGARFTRESSGKAPDIDFSKLP